MADRGRRGGKRGKLTTEVVTERIGRMREYLATSEIDLLLIYTEFRSSSAGKDVECDDFLRLPLKSINAVIKHSSAREKRIANINSITTARLAGIVISIAQSFSKDKTSAVPMDQLLPFPLDEEGSVVVNETRAIIKQLIAKQKLPIHVIAAINKAITM